MDLANVFSVIESVKEQLTRDMERGLRQQDIAKATWALAGKEACDRVRNALGAVDAQQSFAEQRDEEMIRRQQERRDRRAAQRAIRSSENLPSFEVEKQEELPANLEARSEIKKLHQSRTRLLRAIDARQFQQRRKSG